MQTEATPPSPPEAPARGRYGWYVVGVLMLAYTLSYIDRQMMTLLVGPVRAALHISDLQLSLLHGLAFAVFYTVLGLPMGRLADRHDRRNLISAGIATWSVMTSLCGTVRGYGQLFCARIGVGVGEATLSPAAYSLLTDIFPPATRSRALAVFTSGIYIGAAAATFGGGYLVSVIPAMELPLLGHREPWQIIFLVIGVLGLPMTLLTFTIREPVRRELSAMYGARTTLTEAWTYVRGKFAAYGLITLGISVFATLTNGIKSWIPTFLMRTYGMSPGQVGVQFGMILLVCGAGGVACAGFAAAALERRGLRTANLWVAALGAALIVPFGIAAPLAPTAVDSLALYAVVIFLCGVPFGVGPGAIQEITPNQLRGTVSSMYLFWLNLLGIGLGPSLVAAFTDLVFKSDRALNLSLAVIVVITAPLSVLLLVLGVRHQRRALAEVDFAARR
jgi:MFS family permease